MTDYAIPAPASWAKRLHRVAPVAANDDGMTERAARLWPDSEHNRREWLRAVALVRSTKRGWLIERRGAR